MYLIGNGNFKTEIIIIKSNSKITIPIIIKMLSIRSVDRSGAVISRFIVYSVYIHVNISIHTCTFDLISGKTFI